MTFHILNKLLRFSMSALKLFWFGFELVLLFFMSLFLYILFVYLQLSPPEVSEIEVGERAEVSKNHYTLGPNWLRKNEFGVWEMYIEGSAYERGLVYGKLAKELCQRQEEIFVGQINDFVPNEFFQEFLKIFIGYYNKDLHRHIPLENQQEIYGISKSFGDEFNYIGPKYIRHLNYHAAHDIGHALNDYSIVGCTSFALKGDRTSDGNLLVGRNFDFYLGDEFAEDKLLLFMKPDKGYGFVSYSWAGFTGVVSGMNEKGLGVTINASKSDLPTGSKTPISLLAREILQYSSSIKEAIAIAEKRETFVSETIMISSKIDGRSILIEKSPSKMDVYDPKGKNELVCSNHYQSDAFKNDKVNLDNIKGSDSKYRFDRVVELLAANDTITKDIVVSILRNQNASNDDTLGMGNPRAVNQLIAHHSTLMKPEELLFYVSTSDFQLGKFIAYDLNDVFQRNNFSVMDTIQADPFIYTSKYKGFKKFKKVKNRISRYLIFGEKINLTETEVSDFIQLNSESYVTYEMLARYYKMKGNQKKVDQYIDMALTKKVASPSMRVELINLKGN
ncbi:MAG: peptidase C45 [Flavobacteriales bacterium]|nr:peptidase C45 [Flavobacteriales bacterium]